MTKIISQKRWVHGLNTSTDVLSQQPGSLTRVSNLLLTQRGGLQVCDGSTEIALVSSTYTQIDVLALFSNLTPGQFPYYACLAFSDVPVLAEVTGFAVFPVAGAGNPSGTYHFGIVATLGGTHTNIFQSQATLFPFGTFSGIDFTWNAVVGATGYDIYYIPNFAVGGILLQSVGAVTSYTFSGTLPTTTVVPVPSGNNTFLRQLFTGSVVSGGTLTFSAVTAGVFPATPYDAASIAPGSPGFDSSQAVPGFSPYGGISGVTGPLPNLIQFAGQEILILGNGYAPYAYDPSQGASASVTALANTFTAAYPTWQASVSWITGAQIQAMGYVFTAQQGGVSGSGSTPFSAGSYTIGELVADGSVLWICAVKLSGLPAPRGAAHGIAYAGSLWLANTSPQTTTDQLDGPTCLKMSDSNNPNSWNPVNTAFVGRDDGSQITGMAAFTIAAVGISPTGSMAVFKEFLTYQIIGVFGSSNFEIQEAQTDMGCLAARSIQFIPGFGVVRWSHLGFAVYNGVDDRLISEEIRPYLFGGIEQDSDIVPIDPSYVYLARGAQSVHPPMYMCAMPLVGGTGALTRIFCYDLIMKAWIIIDLPWPITSLNRVKASEGPPLVLAGKSDGTIQRMQTGEVQWNLPNSGTDIGWGFRSPDVFGEGSSQRLFYRQFALRGYATNVQALTITATPFIDGARQTPIPLDIVPQDINSKQFEARGTIWMNGQIAHLDIAGTGQVIINSLDWTIEPKSPEARRIIG